MKSSPTLTNSRRTRKDTCRTITAVCLATLVFVGLGWALVATDTDNEAEASRFPICPAGQTLKVTMGTYYPNMRCVATTTTTTTRPPTTTTAPRRTSCPSGQYFYTHPRGSGCFPCPSSSRSIPTGCAGHTRLIPTTTTTRAPTTTTTAPRRTSCPSGQIAWWAFTQGGCAPCPSSSRAIPTGCEGHTRLIPTTTTTTTTTTAAPATGCPSGQQYYWTPWGYFCAPTTTTTTTTTTAPPTTTTTAPRRASASCPSGHYRSSFAIWNGNCVPCPSSSRIIPAGCAGHTRITPPPPTPPPTPPPPTPPSTTPSTTSTTTTTTTTASTTSTTTTAPPTTTTTTTTAAPASASRNITSLSSAGCSNGTFVDTAANPRVLGANNDLVEDCLALVAVQNHWATTANDHLPADHRLRSWGTASNQKINTWPGITVSSKRVTRVNLSNITKSRRTSHFISGTIPPEIGNLKALTYLDLGGNRLSGTIPAQLAQLSRLTTLRLYLNRLTGNIPTQFARLTKLTSLYLNYNRLTGNIPTQLAQITSLKWIKLNNNRLTGTIPAQLARLSDLRQLSVQNNQLTGNIPAGLASLARFTTLGICQNYLTGSVPTRLRTGSKLYGYPTSSGYNPVACQRTSTPTSTTTTRPTTTTTARPTPTTRPTTTPTTTSPPASSSIPILSATGCTDGTFVATTDNTRITGANNDLVEDCQALVAIRNHWTSNPNNNFPTRHRLRTWGTSTNQKINTWPGITVASKRVTAINLSNYNHPYTSNSDLISGTIPARIGNLKALTRLDLGDNRLSGSIPAQLGQLTKLTTLRLFLNSLTGNIPTQLGQLTKLTSLYLNNNQLSGNIPAQLGQLTNLKWLKLNRNRLTGSIPSQLGQLTKLNLLSLHYNRLSGRIPTQLAQLTQLTHLYLNNNQLVGAIPSGLASLARLTHLGICQNDLTGAVPRGLQTGVTLTSYPTSNGYDPVVCQRQTCQSGHYYRWNSGNPNVNGCSPCPTASLTIPTGCARHTRFGLPTLSSAGCTNGTFVNTTANPRSTGANNDLVEDCQTLVAIRNHWTSNTANNGLPASHRLRQWGTITNQRINTWPGITVTSKRVTAINLSNTTESSRNSHFVSGTIPAQIGNLRALTYFDLGGNQLTGDIPAELRHLTKLTSLFLDINQLTGTIPTQLDQLAKLTSLSLYNNRLTGTIPAGLGNLAHLTTLAICQNNLTGTVPARLRTGGILTSYPTVEGYDRVACQRSICQTGYSLYLPGSSGRCSPCPATTTSQTVPTGCAGHTQLVPPTTTSPPTTTAAPTTTTATTLLPDSVLTVGHDPNDPIGSKYANCLKNADAPVYMYLIRFHPNGGGPGCRPCVIAKNQSGGLVPGEVNKYFDEYFALGCPNYCNTANDLVEAVFKNAICNAGSGRSSEIEAAIDSLVDKIYDLACSAIYGRAVPLLMAKNYNKAFDDIDVGHFLKESFRSEIGDTNSEATGASLPKLCPTILEKLTTWIGDVTNWWDSK